MSTYSQSKIANYRGCPRRYKFQYVEKIKLPRKVSPNQQMGSAVHQALSKLYSLGADGVIWSLDQLLAEFNSAWESVDPKSLTLISDNYTIDDFTRIGKDILSRHYERYHPFRPGALIGSELSLWYTLPGTAHKFRTIIDRLSRREDGTVELCDYKTGQQMLRPHDERFILQMGLYQLAVQQNYPQFEEVELVQVYLRQSEEVRYWLSDDEKEELSEFLRQAVYDIEEAGRLDDFPAREDNQCVWCDYTDICPAKRHRRVLEEIEESDTEQVSPEIEAARKAELYIDVDQRLKVLKAEKDALREEIVDLAAELNVSRLDAPAGHISIRVGGGEKFITRSDNIDKFISLSDEVRAVPGMDVFFEFNTRSFMSQVYRKGLLSDEQRAAVGKYLVPNRTVTVRVVPKKDKLRRD